MLLLILVNLNQLVKNAPPGTILCTLYDVLGDTLCGAPDGTLVPFLLSLVARAAEIALSTHLYFNNFAVHIDIMFDRSS